MVASLGSAETKAMYEVVQLAQHCSKQRMYDMICARITLRVEKRKSVEV